MGETRGQRIRSPKRSFFTMVGEKEALYFYTMTTEEKNTYRREVKMPFLTQVG